MNDVEWNKLMEDNAILALRTDLAISSPQSYTVEEVRKITSDLEASSDKIEAVMREDFQKMSPEEQRRMMESLVESGVESREWWEHVLYGEER